MALGAPDFGDTTTPVFNPLVYPRRIIIEVLESAFSQDILFGYPGSPPNPYKYKVAADGGPADDSGIVIADTFSDSLVAADPRPIITVDRGAFQFADVAIDGMGQRGATPALATTDADGDLHVMGGAGVNQSFQDFATMSLSLNCYARRSLEAEQVAWLSGGFIRFFEREIKLGASIHRLDSPVIGEVRSVRADSQNDLFVCPITLVVHQVISWNKTNTAEYDQILAGLSSINGSSYPKAYTMPPCTESTPDNLSTTDKAKWLGTP